MIKAFILTKDLSNIVIYLHNFSDWSIVMETFSEVKFVFIVFQVQSLLIAAFFFFPELYIAVLFLLRSIYKPTTLPISQIAVNKVYLLSFCQFLAFCNFKLDK